MRENGSRAGFPAETAGIPHDAAPRCSVTCPKGRQGTSSPDLGGATALRCAGTAFTDPSSQHKRRSPLHSRTMRHRSFSGQRRLNTKEILNDPQDVDAFGQKGSMHGSGSCRVPLPIFPVLFQGQAIPEAQPGIFRQAPCGPMPPVPVPPAFANRTFASLVDVSLSLSIAALVNYLDMEQPAAFQNPGEDPCVTVTP